MATFRVEAALLRQLRQVKVETGVAVSEQIRRGILLWLNSPKTQTFRTFMRKFPAKREAAS